MLYANKINQLREDRELLQKQLSVALEIDTPMYSKIEQGENLAKRKQITVISPDFCKSMRTNF